ncbi:MAG: hypothetical protein U1F36_14020 [Planctomycetota bacterium]
MSPVSLLHHALCACGIVVVLTTGSMPAQSVRWNLPDDHSLTYRRERRVDTKGIEPAARPGDPRPPAFGMGSPFGAGVLLAADLEPKRRQLGREPLDLSELIPWLAFDLTTFRSGKWKGDQNWVKPFGHLQIETEGDAPLDGGTQTVRIKIRRAPLDESRIPGPARERKQRGERLANSYDTDIDALLVIQRTFDAEHGRIAEFDAQFDATVSPRNDPKWKHVGMTITEKWRFDREDVADSTVFRERVGDAIRMGREHLSVELEKALDRVDRHRPPDAGGVDVPVGEVALTALTLIKADIKRDDKTLLDALQVLRECKLRDTYTLGITLMAFEAFYADPNERQHLVEGLIDRPQKRNPSDADRKLMTEWIQLLLENRDQAADRSKLSRWTYTPGSGFDHSNSQYALLGLYSAHLCGIDVPVEVWNTSARHWLDMQCQSEGNGNLSIFTYKQLAQARGRPTSTGVDVRGWSYRYPAEEPYGSMTAAGTASLTLAQSAMRDLGGRNDLIGEAGKAIRSGYAWLARHLDVRSNPGRPPEHDAWRYYWLYGLERACEIGQVARLNERDWYFEGASLLLAMQRDDGSFEAGGLADNCFAILFLKKAQVPVATGR